MKLKQQPEDFSVEELTGVSPGDRGPFGFYQLEKRGWTTPDAMAAVRRRWRVAANNVAFGGLKDRHAHTVQHFTIWRGPRRGLTHQGIVVHYLGQVQEPFSSSCIRANRFHIVLRDLTTLQAASARDVLECIRSCGVPNYFDDQRFGSVVCGGEFVAKYMILRQFDAALQLALTAPYEFDRGADKRAKAMMLASWGQWAKISRQLPRGHVRDLIEYLGRNPDDFCGALARLRPELQGLYLAAFQSHLWNRILARRLADIVSPNDLRPIHLKLGDLPIPVQLDAEQRTQLLKETIPLPAARWPFDPAAKWADPARRVLAEEELTWEGLKINGMRKPFFTRGERHALCVPAALTGEVAPDDRHPGQSTVNLSFELPRGSYATIVVKRVLM